MSDEERSRVMSAHEVAMSAPTMSDELAETLRRLVPLRRRPEEVPS